MNTNKIDLTKAEVERLKSNLIHGACSSQIAMETRCKEEAYNEVLALLDSLQEEPVSVWHDVSEEPKPNMELICVGQYGNPLVLSSNSNSFKERYISKWAYFNDLLNLSNVQRTVNEWKEEPVSEDLEEAAKYYIPDESYHMTIGSKEEGSGEYVYDYVQMLDMFKAGAKWQETKDKQVLNEEGVVVLPEEAFERMKRSLIELAEKEQQMTANAFEGAYIRRNRYTKKNVLNGFDVTCDAIQGFKNGDKVKVIVIKED